MHSLVREHGNVHFFSVHPMSQPIVIENTEESGGTAIGPNDLSAYFEERVGIGIGHSIVEKEMVIEKLIEKVVVNRFLRCRPIIGLDE